MMDTFFDIMNSLLGAIFMLLSLIFIPEIRKSKRYSSCTIAAIILLLSFGIWEAIYHKNKRQETELKQQKDSGTINSLKTTLVNWSNSRKADSINRSKFEADLRDSFHIVRDLTTNKPKVISNTYNTHLHDVGTLNIGNNN